MKTFKFWVKAALVLASALGVIGIISIIVFQVLYGWHTDILSPVEHLVRSLLLLGGKAVYVCAGLAIAKLLMLVYSGEVLTKEPIKPSSKPHGIALYLVRHILRLLNSKGYKLTDDEYADIALYAQSILESKNIPIPEKDEDLWKLIEPKVKQYTKPATPEESFDPSCVGNPTQAMEQQFSEDLGKEPWVGGVETTAYKSVKDRLTEVAQTPTQDACTVKPNTDCPNGYPKFSVRTRLLRIIREHGYKWECNFNYLYSICQVSLKGAELSTYNDTEIWAIIQPALEDMDSKSSE